MAVTAGLAASAFVILLTLCYNRYITAPQQNVNVVNGRGSHNVPPIPYWIPWIGHSISLFWDPEPFLRDMR